MPTSKSNSRDRKKAELAQRPKAREDVVFRQMDDEWVVFDPVGKKMHVLNVTAGLVWSRLDGETTMEEIVAAVCEAFDPPALPDTVARDVCEITNRFRAEGLLA